MSCWLLLLVQHLNGPSEPQFLSPNKLLLSGKNVSLLIWRPLWEENHASRAHETSSRFRLTWWYLRKESCILWQWNNCLTRSEFVKWFGMKCRAPDVLKGTPCDCFARVHYSLSGTLLTSFLSRLQLRLSMNLLSVGVGRYSDKWTELEWNKHVGQWRVHSATHAMRSCLLSRITKVDPQCCKRRTSAWMTDWLFLFLSARHTRLVTWCYRERFRSGICAAVCCPSWPRGSLPPFRWRRTGQVSKWSPAWRGPGPVSHLGTPCRPAVGRSTADAGTRWAGSPNERNKTFATNEQDRKITWPPETTEEHVPHIIILSSHLNVCFFFTCYANCCWSKLNVL